MPQPSGERTDLISDAIRSQAEQQAKEIISKANAFRTEELEKCKTELNLQGIAEYRDALNTAQKDSVLSVSHAEQNSMQELLRHRQKLEETIFSNVRQRLEEYTLTEDYRQSVLSRISELKAHYPHEHTTVSLQDSDMALADQIQALLPGCAVQGDKKNHLGGFILNNPVARIYIDETLESKLAAQREWYLEKCHLKVN